MTGPTSKIPGKSNQKAVVTPKPVEPPTKTTGQEFRPVPVSGRIRQAAPETAQKPAIAPTGPAPKKTKLTAEDRRRQFELLTDGDKKALADQWFKPEMRAGAAAVTFADKESFEFVLSLAPDKRKGSYSAGCEGWW